MANQCFATHARHQPFMSNCRLLLFQAASVGDVFGLRTCSSMTPSGKDAWLLDSIKQTVDITGFKLVLKGVQDRLKPMQVHAALSHMDYLLQEAKLSPRAPIKERRERKYAARILEKACVKLNDRQLMAQCNDMLRHQMVNCAATPAFLAAWTSLLKNTGDTAVTEQHRRAAESLVDTILEWVDNPQHGIRENIERKWEDMEVLSSCVADNAHWLAPADAVKCLDKLASVGLCNSNAYMAVADALHKNRGVDVLSGNDVVHLLWALAKSETVHEGLLEHIVKVLPSVVPSLDAKGLATLLWSGSKLRKQGSDTVHDAITGTGVGPALATLSPDSLAPLAWSCVLQAKRSLRDVVRALGLIATKHAQSMSVVDLMRVMHAGAMYRCHCPEFMAAALDRIKVMDPSMLMAAAGAGRLTNLLWTMAATGCNEPLLARQLLVQLMLAHACGQLSSHDMASVVAACARLRLDDHAVVACLLHSLKHVTVSAYRNKGSGLRGLAGDQSRGGAHTPQHDRQAGDEGPAGAMKAPQDAWLPPAEASALLYAVADMNHQDIDFARSLIKKLLLVAPSRTAATGKWPGPLAGQNNPRELCAVAYAGARLGIQDKAVWQAVVAGIAPSLHFWGLRWQPTHTAGMLWALAEVVPGHKGIPEQHASRAASALLARVHLQLPELSPSQLMDVVWSAARLGVVCHEAVQNALQRALVHAVAGEYSTRSLLQLLWSAVVSSEHNAHAVLLHLAPALRAQVPRMELEDCAHIGYCYLQAASCSVPALVGELTVRCVQLVHAEGCSPDMATKLLSAFAPASVSSAHMDPSLVKPLVETLLARLPGAALDIKAEPVSGTGTHTSGQQAQIGSGHAALMSRAHEARQHAGWLWHMGDMGDREDEHGEGAVVAGLHG